MRALVVYLVFFGTAGLSFFFENIYLLLAAPVAATAASVLMRMTGRPKTD